MYDIDDLNYRDRLRAGYFQTQRVLAFGGREWALESSTTKAFEQRIVNQNLVSIIFAISLLLTFTLAWLVWLLITQKQQAEVWFEKLFQQIAEGMVVIDNKHQIVEMNPAARQIFTVGDTSQSFPMLNHWFRHDAAMMIALNDVRKGIPITIETSVASSGTMLPLNVQMQPLDGGYYFLTIVDLTEQKEKTRRIERLTHIYQALSETNQAIVRMDDTSELLPLVCRCAVQFGEMQLAWIGKISAEGNQVEHVCSAASGRDNNDDACDLLPAGLTGSDGLTADVCKQGRAIVINDFLTDSSVRHWHEAAKQNGWGSVAAFPIFRAGESYAVLTVFHPDKNAFNHEVLALLTEMTSDISFALDNHERNLRKEQAEKALAESEATLSTIMENVSACIYMKDLNGRYVYANRQLLKLWNTESDQITGKTDEAFFNWRSVARLRANDRLVLDRGQSVSCEETCTITHSGDTVDFWSVKLPLKDENGKIYGLCGISTDITEIKRAERALQDSEARYRLIYAANPIPMWVYDLETLQFMTVNDAAVMQYGYSKEEFLTMSIADLHPDSVLDDLYKCIAETRAGGDDYYNEAGVWPHKKKDGTQIWVEITAHTMIFEGRSAEIILAHDVSDRLEAENTLRLNAQVFEASREGILITDSQQRIVSVNRAYQQMTGHDKKYLLGRKPAVFLSNKFNRNQREALLQQLEVSGYWVGEVDNERADGEHYPEWVSVSVTRNSAGLITHYVLILTDLTERKAAEAKIQFLTHFDSLTQLPNMAMLRERAEQILGQLDKQSQPASLLFVDLDRFKFVNDSLGPSFGDEFLKQLAQRITASVSRNAMVCRQGGDEFIILVPDSDTEHAAHMARDLLEIISQPAQVRGHQLTLTASIGIAQFPQDGKSFELLLQAADAAVFRAKQQGRKTFQFFTRQMQEQAQQTLQLENDLRSAIEQKQLLLHYQPQVDANTGALIGLEALIRWQHPERGMVPPGQFIPLAEESGLIVEIGDWVLDEAARQISQWQADGFEVVPVAVNLSVEQFRTKTLLETVRDVLRRYKLDPALLELELTEGIAMDNTSNTVQLLQQLHSLGVTLSIDDFGTGYSSLNYLKRFPLHKLKIDQSFVRDIGHNTEDEAIVVAIIGMAKSLGFTTIAEGVETIQQIEFLREQQCEQLQGYYFSKPIAADGLMNLITSHKGVFKLTD
ncbi:MAG: EAL domain-containing protein [Methylophaga sp.]|nr:EAL domain-containing protein [Methylophaga sp.]